MNKFVLVVMVVAVSVFAGCERLKASAPMCITNPDGSKVCYEPAPPPPPVVVQQMAPLPSYTAPQLAK